MSLVRVSLLGKLCVTCDETPVERLDTRKVQELFCYLLLYRTLAHPREALADLLWGGSITARSYLRKTLYHLQSALHALPLGSDHQGCNSILLVESDWVQLNPKASIWLDIAVFEEVFGRLKGISGQALDEQSVKDLENAVALYQGELLTGWYQEWCLFERERFRHMYLSMLDKLMAYYEFHHDYDMAVACGLAVLRQDSAREHTHRNLMHLYYLAGDRSAALRQYALCVASLAENLDVQPSEPTETLYQQIRAGQVERALLPLIPNDGANNAPSSLSSKALDHVQQLRARLAEFQQQVQQELDAMDLILNKLR